MMRITGLLMALLLVSGVMAQTETKPKKSDRFKNLDLRNRANDHLMIQLGSYHWGQAPDSLNIKGFSRSFNFYLLYDFPFKTDPRFSVALGAGIGSDHLFFKNTTIDVKANDRLYFTKDSISDYRKYKLMNAFLEAPVELRFSAHPETPNKSFKIALGLKVGTMIDAHTRARIDKDANGVTNYTLKEKSKKYFNSTRLSATGRIGYGNFTLFANYQINEYIREGFGPSAVKPFSIGLTISGL